MGLFVKRNHGIEYIYMVVGKSHYFLGRKDDPQNVNLENLRKAITAVDKNFERTLAKYLQDMQEQAGYLPDDERARYVSDRIKRLGRMLDMRDK